MNSWYMKYIVHLIVDMTKHIHTHTHTLIYLSGIEKIESKSLDVSDNKDGICE